MWRKPTIKHVFVVGSWENHFIADRVYTDEDKAIGYCESRKGDGCEWGVMRAPIGGDWLQWQPIRSCSAEPMPQRAKCE